MKSFLHYINEARSHPELNPKIGYVQALEKYKDDPNYYISFRSINKLGINPHNNFNTPIGIYCYPLKEMWDTIKNDEIPFQGDNPAKYVAVFKKNKSAKMLTNKCSSAEVEKAWNALEKKYNFVESNHPLFPKKEDYFYNTSTMEKAKTNLQKIWYLTYNVTMILNQKTSFHRISSNGTTVLWADVLRNAGYDGVEDRLGKGVIHENEPIQAVFFTKSAITLVDMLENKRYDPLEQYQKDQISNNIQIHSVKVDLSKKILGIFNKYGNSRFQNINITVSAKSNINIDSNSAIISNIRFNSSFTFENKSHNTILFDNCIFTEGTVIKNCHVKQSLGLNDNHCSFTDCKIMSNSSNMYLTGIYNNCILDTNAGDEIILSYNNISNIHNVKLLNNNNALSILDASSNVNDIIDGMLDNLNILSAKTKEITIKLGNELFPSRIIINDIFGKDTFSSEDIKILKHIILSIDYSMKYEGEIKPSDVFANKATALIKEMYQDIKNGRLSLQDLRIK